MVSCAASNPPSMRQLSQAGVGGRSWREECRQHYNVAANPGEHGDGGGSAAQLRQKCHDQQQQQELQQAIRHQTQQEGNIQGGDCSVGIASIAGHGLSCRPIQSQQPRLLPRAHIIWVLDTCPNCGPYGPVQLHQPRNQVLFDSRQRELLESRAVVLAAQRKGRQAAAAQRSGLQKASHGRYGAAMCKLPEAPSGPSAVAREHGPVRHASGLLQRSIFASGSGVAFGKNRWAWCGQWGIGQCGECLGDADGAG
ncbi:hypothetical protein VOLCADRAFT_92349 [Volvox carteri f. nagariensis]|uniref:Uncharacterized protein n=1 Tax=Volvox carteri f. nagariensis TaxID=3068 RepID=D8TZF6_VOLCA|nr:uncharacterized protein VOLCADRAFT_92349 [Volvox carteri f. nagariensis]EFJ47267.1 hypothetical protein VOLCADRAFT_92349 [Volvox carteri f. nagariensis]|eukprot:XP_002951816.1 hypothetical protein VOLCADRAFT_92349 [Volvox carteri f. nagariensis]